RQASRGWRWGRRKGDKGDQVGESVPEDGLPTFRAPTQSGGAAAYHHGPPVPRIDRHPPAKSRRTGPAVLGLDGAQAGRVLPAARAVTGDYGRMGPPAAAPRRAPRPAHPDLEDLG